MGLVEEPTFKNGILDVDVLVVVYFNVQSKRFPENIYYQLKDNYEMSNIEEICKKNLKKYTDISFISVFQKSLLRTNVFDLYKTFSK